MLKFFLDSDSGDGQSAQNFKAVPSPDSKAHRLYQRGHLQKILVVRVEYIVYYKARCGPEMKTKFQYKLQLCVFAVVGDGEDAQFLDSLLYAERSCPEGKAPKASCKHLAALIYAFEDICQHGYMGDMITCIDELQKWNQPTKRNSEPMKVSKMVWTKKSAQKADQDWTAIKQLHDQRWRHMALCVHIRLRSADE